VFPCFDQPNLKAKMSLSVLSPAAWKVVSNSIEYRYDQASKEGMRIVEKIGLTWALKHYAKPDDVAAYEFEQTPKISTYLYAICAGPYRVFEDRDPQHVPQRVFVRESLVQNLRYELVMGITKTTIVRY